MGDADIRLWFLKQPHKKGKESGEPNKETQSPLVAPAAPDSRPDLKKTSRYFSGSKAKPSNDVDAQKSSPEEKRKQHSSPSKSSLASSPASKKARIEPKPAAVSARARAPDDDENDDGDFEDVAEIPSPVTPAKGRGRGRGRGSASSSKDKEPSPAAWGRGGGGGGGRGGGAFHQPRQPPPHKGEKEVPQGAEDCLSGLTFVISGTLDSLEREEAEDLIKQHGGRITTSISKKTSYLLADEDIGGRKSQKAKELGVPFLTEDGLFDKIRASKPNKEPSKQLTPKTSVHDARAQKSGRVERSYPGRAQNMSARATGKPLLSPSSGGKPRGGAVETEAWPQKYSPKSSVDMIGNQSIVKQLHDWLQHWFEQNSQGKQQKGKKRGDEGGGSNAKKAVLMSGPPGVGKTTSARMISKMLGFEAFEVNASDNRGKADSKVAKGVSGSTANAIKEMVSNESLVLGANGDKHRKAVLIMDEVDGMSGGDRGGVADLIASIKISKIPIICICNDRYSQKLKSLANYCLPLNFRKPTKQQMAKRLQQVAQAEGMQADEIALEELAERVNGDMRMALNELQYMSLRAHIIKFNDVKARLGSNAKDEDMSPFNAVDRLMSYDGGRLRMDERLDASMSDLDLVPLLIQENYLNYYPAMAGRDDNGVVRMDLIARSAASIADGDIVNVQIRQFRQWQHSQMAAFLSSIIPAALMHGRRETLVQGERNFNRFGGWLGKNSTYGKNLRLLDDVHVHMLASRICEPTRQAVRRDYFDVLTLRLTAPLKSLPKEEAVRSVVDFMEEYSLTPEDMDSILTLTRFQGQPNPMVGIQPVVKAALTKAYKQKEGDRRVRSADLLPVFSASGKKVIPKKHKRMQLVLAEVDGDETVAEDDDDEPASPESEDEEADDTHKLAALQLNGRVELTLDEGNKGKQGKRSQALKRSAPKVTDSKQPAKRRKG